MRPGSGTATVPVHAGRGYDVIVGAGMLDDIGAIMGSLGKPCRVAVITDDIVAPLYLEKTRVRLADAGFRPSTFTIPHGEASKNAENYLKILGFLAESSFTRSDSIIALGGGVVGDIAGFAAATYLRGIGCIQVPTTMLAAIDSSIGGKTAIDLPSGKNLVGAFHQPRAVVCDTDCLSTLPRETLAQGMAEALKYGVLCDEPFFESIEEGRLNDPAGAIARCASIKRDYVEADEHEKGPRRFLNLGHTIGHAVEHCSSFSIPHGNAVAIGLAMMARANEAAGAADAGTAARITAACAKWGLPTECSFDVDLLASAALQDKKRDGDDITIVGIRRIGSCFLESMPIAGLKALMKEGAAR